MFAEGDKCILIAFDQEGKCTSRCVNDGYLACFKYLYTNGVRI